MEHHHEHTLVETVEETIEEVNPLDELRWWEILIVPVIVFVLLYGIRYLLTLLGMPSDSDVLIAYLKNLINTYGFAISIVGAFLEGLLLVGWYFPGSFIIFLSVILAGSIPETILAVTVVTLGLYASYTVNYLLGKYGWYRLLAKFGMESAIHDSAKRLKDYGPKAIFMTYWQPGLASFTATGAGVIGYPFVRFLIESAIALVFWNAFWGTVAYMVGEQVLKMLFNWYFVCAILFGWTMMQWYERWQKKTKKHHTHPER